MEPVGTHGLACLGEEDYAAVALYMQDQALIIDGALDAVSDAFDSYRLRPGFVSASNANFLNTPVNTLGTIGASTVVYSNFTMTGATGFITPRQGWWQFGANVNMVASGAVTVGSYRKLFVSAIRSSAPAPATTLAVTSDLSYDTNTGGEWLACSGGSFYAPAGALVTIRAETMHGNAASGVNTIAGARTWCFFIGSGIEIGSA